MNNNNHPYQNPTQTSGTSSTNYYSKYQDKTTSHNSFPLYQNLTPTSRPQTYDRFKLGEHMDYKQKNRGMYQSSMNYTSSSDSSSGLASLSSFARKVQETPVGRQKFQTSDDKYLSFMNKYADQSGKDLKMASSAIFSQNNTSSEQFNRFPSFNLPTNPNINRPTSFKSPIQSTSQTNPNQTAKQKRQRQIAAIKKQLESLNKKMLNKPIPNISSTAQELRPGKPSGVSQSISVESSSSHNSDSTVNSNYGVTGVHEYSSPRNINSNYDQKFKSKKYTQYTQPTTPTQQPTIQKTPDYEPKNPYTYTSPSYTLNNNYMDNTRNNNKYDTITKPQISNKYSTTNTYDSPSYGVSSNSYTDQYSGNYGVSSSNNNSSTTSSYPYTYSGSSNSSSYQNSSNTYSTTPKVQPYKPENTSTTNKYSYETYTSPKAADTTTQQTGFKKKKYYQPEQPAKKIQPTKPLLGKPTQDTKNPYNNPVSLASTSSSVSSQRPGFKVKKMESFDYIDSSIHVPQARKFKYSDFIISKKMGKGQFGEVLLVRHKETGWLCGLKVMEKKQIRDQDYVSQIARQLSIQFYLNHRNIAQLYGYFQDETKFYLLIQFCTGGQLLQLLRKQKRMQQKDVSKIIRQTCQGIDYIHKQQIIHRDLKPENILFNFGVVKICDFGWAVYRGFGMRKTVSGSPLYYPPQIVKGEEYDDKIDVWNIGMMTYECLLGKIPFRVYSELDLGKIVSDQITFPSYVDVSDEAQDFILKTMKKKGDERIELRQMLRHPFLSKAQDTQLSKQILDQFRRVLQ